MQVKQRTGQVFEKRRHPKVAYTQQENVLKHYIHALKYPELCTQLNPTMLAIPPHHFAVCLQAPTTIFTMATGFPLRLPLPPRTCLGTRPSWSLLSKHSLGTLQTTTRTTPSFLLHGTRTGEHVIVELEATTMQSVMPRWWWWP